MNILLYIMTVLIWGSTWFAITCQLGTIPLDLSIFYRFGLAALLIFGWCFFKKRSLRFSWETHIFFIAQGFFLFSMNYMAAYEANLYISSGLNAIGFSMILVFNIINSAIFYRTPLTLPVFAGAICGIVGMITIFWPAIVTLDFTNTSLLGIVLSLLGGLLASFGNLISARNQKKSIPVMENNAYGMGYGALWMLGIILIKGVPFQFDISYTYILSLLHLAIFGSIVAFGCYLTLLGRIGVSKAAYALVMVPVVALIVSTFFEDFTWESHVFVGVGLIIFGNVLILAKKSVKKNVDEKSQALLFLKKAA